MQTRRTLMGRAGLAGLFGLGACGPAKSMTSEPSDETQALVDNIRLNAKAVALTAGVYDGTGLVKAYVSGKRKANVDEPATLDDLWHIGSNTKAMTAALWARLVEKGLAHWDMALSEAVQKAGLGFAVHPAWEGVTVEQLLRHRGGLTDTRVIGRAWLMTARDDPRSLKDQRSQIAKSALEVAPDAPVGTFAYGNANYMVVGAIIEGLTGRAWEEAMQAEVFTPLGMTRSGFGAPQDPAPWGHRAVMAMKMPVDPKDKGSDNPMALGPAGTVHVSLSDYGRFLAAIIRGGGDWLSQDSVQRLVRAKAGETYALGRIVLPPQPWAKGQVIGHEGSNTLWHAFSAIDLGSGKAWVAMSNDAPGGAQACSEAGLALAHRTAV